MSLGLDQLRMFEVVIKKEEISWTKLFGIVTATLGNTRNRSAPLFLMNK